MPAWWRGLLAWSGRLVLIKSVILARPIHQLLVADALVWLLEEINKWIRAFFWVAKDKVLGGQCLIAWDRICQPTEFGGLGVKNLQLQGLALRILWEWLRRTDASRPWQGLPALKDQKAREVFDSLVVIRVGDGAKTLFWYDRWLRGRSVAEYAPEVHALVTTQCKNIRTVQQTLLNHRWLNDVRGALSLNAMAQCLLLLSLVTTFFRDAEVPDEFTWPCAKNGQYSARETYKRLCLGRERWEGASYVWRCWAPLRCKIFAWLALHARLWTADRRFRFGLQTTRSSCFTCLQEEDTVKHIMAGCVYTRQVWVGWLLKLQIMVDAPQMDDSLQSWWFRTRTRFGSKERRGFDSLVVLVSWRLWRQRNVRCFNNIQKQFSV
jgi:hypothetical protein